MLLCHIAILYTKTTEMHRIELVDMRIFIRCDPLFRYLLLWFCPHYWETLRHGTDWDVCVCVCFNSLLVLLLACTLLPSLKHALNYWNSDLLYVPLYMQMVKQQLFHNTQMFLIMNVCWRPVAWPVFRNGTVCHATISFTTVTLYFPCLCYCEQHF